MGDESKLLKLIESRLQTGFKEYGALKIASDNRNYIQETLEEVADGLVYIASKLIQLQEPQEYPDKVDRLKLEASKLGFDIVPSVLHGKTIDQLSQQKATFCAKCLEFFPAAKQ